MSQWITRRNIEHFEEMLVEEKDPHKRRVLEKLLDEEREKQRREDAEKGD